MYQSVRESQKVCEGMQWRVELVLVLKHFEVHVLFFSGYYTFDISFL